MKQNYGYETTGYFDLKYKLHTPMEPKGYGIPSLYRGPRFFPYGNHLVSHILQTIDQRTAENDPPGESIDELFEDRLGLIRSKIELILLQLEQRKEINREILSEIDRDSCKAQDLIFEMGYRAYRMDRDRLTLEKTKFDLESQKRMEEASYFRDTGLLNKDLKDTLIQYLGEVQKSRIIGSEEEP